MTTTARQVLADRTWLHYLLVGAALTLAYYALPAEGAWGVARVALYCAISASVAPAVFVGLVRHKPCNWLPWLLIGVGQLVYAVGDACFYSTHYLLRDTAFPAVADAFYLAHHPIIVVGVILLIRQRSPGRDLPSMIDASVLAVVGAMLSWLYLIEPRVQTDSTLLITFASLAYPVMDLVLLAVALRLLLAPGRRPLAFGLLTINLLVFFAADTTYIFQRLNDIYVAGNFLDAIWLSGLLALGAAGLHPTMAVLGEAAPIREQNLGPVRVLALATAALVAPVTLVVQHARGKDHDVPVIAMACAALFLLTICRLIVVVSQQRRLAVTDSLTGLHTRRHFETHLPQAVARSDRTRKPLAVFVLDIDHFKSINDGYGHVAGDRVLVEVAARLRQVVGPHDVLARYGGEEFILLVHDADDSSMTDTAETLRSSVASSPIAVSTEDLITVTVSVGAACHPDQVGSPDQLVAIADRALYSAKAHGRDCIALGNPTDSATPRDHTAAVDYLHALADHVDRCASDHVHSRAVGRWARLVCEEMLDDTTRVRQAELAGRLHDIGKVVVPEVVLAAGSVADGEQARLLRLHPDHGARLLRPVPGFADIAEVVRQQHERFDGTGCPDAIAGSAIRFEARVIAVCNAWAEMRSDSPPQQRPPRQRLSVDDAVQQLRDGQGTEFDPDVVDVFLALHSAGRIETRTMSEN